METEALEQMKSFYDQFIGELESHALTAEELKGGTRGIAVISVNCVTDGYQTKMC